MAWIDAPPENRTSLKGISAAGFVEVATLERKLLCRWFTYQRYRAIVHAPLGKFFKQLPSRWTNFS
jgi:hypothetical protein